jgi:predicted 3-demethylubiquinone-9 3-methyltransferase (glyoxalase superfamily)
MQKITPFLWFNDKAEEAAKLYVSIFPNSKIIGVARYDEAGAKASGRPIDTAMTVSFILDGQEFTALNGGPMFPFTEAISFVVSCASQEEVDHYWDRLTEDGGQESQCGWLKDKFGMSWQIVPNTLGELMSGNPEKTKRVMEAMLKMKKLDIKQLQQAHDQK